MGASNQTTSNVKFYKLKEDEREKSDTKGHLMFFEQEKTGDKWGDGIGFNTLEGIITGIKIKDYEWQGQKKEVLEIELSDVDMKMVFSLGLRSIAAQNIINTLAGENVYGTMKFATGKPKEYNGKMYTTLYINNDGEKTAWKFSKVNENLDLIPKVTTIKDEDGNVIKKGQKAQDEFWKEVILTDIVPKIKNGKITPNQSAGATGADFGHESVPVESDFGKSDPNDDLPF